MIRVVLFARLREELGVASTEIPGEVIRLSGVIESLVTINGSAWREALTAENVLVAVNQTMVKGDAEVCDGDEVAFFPPVTGG